LTIFLASASPRRKQLLEQVNCSFQILVSDIVEDHHRKVLPGELATLNAASKARDVAARVEPDDVVIGADTVVALDGHVYGKPQNEQEARRMLAKLSGREHTVYTGVAVVRAGRLWTDYAETKVRIRSLNLDEIDRYVATGEPLDKAGAYGVQGIGAILVEAVYGCYSNVVGLPLVTLSRLLIKAGIRLL